MRFSAPLLTVAGTVAGTAAAVVAYQATAGGAVTARPVSLTTPTTAPTSISWLPCEPGWKVKGNVCVRVEDKVVVVHDLPAPAAPPAQPAGVRSSSSVSGHDDARGDDGQEVNEADEAEDPENETDDQGGEDAEHASDDGSDHEDVGTDD